MLEYDVAQVQNSLKVIKLAEYVSNTPLSMGILLTVANPRRQQYS